MHLYVTDSVAGGVIKSVANSVTDAKATAQLTLPVCAEIRTFYSAVVNMTKA